MPSIIGRQSVLWLVVYHWDGQNIVLEVNGHTNAVKARYLRGSNLVAQEIENDLFYYLFNAHGDVIQRLATGENHAPVYKYDAFGNEQKPVDTDPNPFRYCGEYWDADIGELYLRNRNYDPRTGRFSREDPARSGGNWYSYCGGNPVTRSDPSGLSWISDLLGSIGSAAKKAASNKKQTTTAAERRKNWEQVIAEDEGWHSGSGVPYPAETERRNNGENIFAEEAAVAAEAARAAEQKACRDAIVITGDFLGGAAYNASGSNRDFGERNVAVGSNPHGGHDYTTWGNPALWSVWYGTVEKVDFSDARGQYVIIKLNPERYGAGKYILMQHLDSVNVEEGQNVPPGTQIGASGDSGIVSGEHLHLEVLLDYDPGVGSDGALFRGDIDYWLVDPYGPLAVDANGNPLIKLPAVNRS